MTVEIYILTGLIGLAICAATFLGGKVSAAKKDAERFVKLELKLDHRDELFKAKLDHMDECVRGVKAQLIELTNGQKSSVADVHERIDEHLRSEHKMTIPKRRS